MSITHLFNIDRPIIQAPMAGVQNHQLAAAVSNAGGLGSLPCARLTAEEVDKELHSLQSVTNKPFNVNFFTHKHIESNAEEEHRWLQHLSPYFEEFNLSVDGISAPTRLPFNNEMADVVEAYRPAVVSFHFGLPSADLVDRVKSWGSKIISSATTVEEALWLEQHGVDAVIAQGLEAGGHRGHFLSHDLSKQLGSFALVPQIANAINIPVIAAGGIGSAESVAALIALGASGVQAGTSFLLCHEASTSCLHKQAISEHPEHTALTNILSGRPARSIVNRVIDEIGPFNSDAPTFPHALAAMGALKQAAEAQGKSEFSSLWCGQNASACESISASDMVEKLMNGWK